MSKQILMMLFDNMFEKDEHGHGTANLLPEPIPLHESDVVKYFMDRITATQTAIDCVEDGWGKKLIENLIKRAWGFNASEGVYTDEDMIEMGVNECFGCHEEQGLIKRVLDRGWIVKKEFFQEMLDDHTNFFSFIINEIEL